MTRIKYQIDDVDRKIIKALLKNSRKSLSEIANNCGLSTLTIKNRYARLKKEGIIRGSTILLNLSAFSYEVFAIYLVKVPNNVDFYTRKLNEIFANRQEAFCQKVDFNERYNIVISFALKDITELQKVKEFIRSQNFVLNVEVNLVSCNRVIPENLSLQTDD